jgi:hypothetical protein
MSVGINLMCENARLSWAQIGAEGYNVLEFSGFPNEDSHLRKINWRE